MYPSIYMGPPDRVMRVHSEAAGCVMSFVLCAFECPCSAARGMAR